MHTLEFSCSRSTRLLRHEQRCAGKLTAQKEKITTLSSETARLIKLVEEKDKNIKELQADVTTR